MLLAANPLDDIRNARQVSGVVINGRYTDRAALDSRREALADRYRELRDINTRVDVALAADMPKDSIVKLMTLHEGDSEAQNTIEQRINAAGYGAAFADDMDRSIAILRMNTELFPASANTWDSLGEVTLYLGNRDDALRFYRKALEVDPDLASAAEQIQKLEAGE